MASGALSRVQIRISSSGRSPRKRLRYAETQNGPLSKFMNIAELQQVATTRFVGDFSLIL